MMPSFFRYFRPAQISPPRKRHDPQKNKAATLLAKPNRRFYPTMSKHQSYAATSLPLRTPSLSCLPYHEMVVRLISKPRSWRIDATSFGEPIELSFNHFSKNLYALNRLLPPFEFFSQRARIRSTLRVLFSTSYALTV